MTIPELIGSIYQKKSFLCVGLDIDITKLPSHLPKTAEGVLEFNSRIIAATLTHCVAYKINTAFYEAMGNRGWEILLRTRQMIPQSHLAIADAKRGDISNTSRQYARAFFEEMDFDALTVAPYMGSDSVEPFLAYSHKITIVLGLTSNAGSKDFQMLRLESGRPLYLEVIEKMAQLATAQNLMFVVGATHSESLQEIRRIVPEHFLLIPGVGAQGGELETVCRHGLTERGGLLVNSSREILYARQGEDFAEAAAEKAAALATQMSLWLN